ncbi:MAG: tetratricopeptide repeat protein [Pseudomonadales bacterium]
MSDYLTDEEQLHRLRTWWEKNGLALIGAVVVGVAGVVGWNWYTQHRSEDVAQASDLYVEYLASQGTERETVEKTLAEQFPDSSYHVFVLLRQAEDRMAEDDASGALALLEQALPICEDDHLADLVRLRTARVQQQLDRTDAALATLGDVRSLGFRSMVQELKGDIHMSRGERALAHEAYSAALTEAGQGAQRPLLELKAANTAQPDDA